MVYYTGPNKKVTRLTRDSTPTSEPTPTPTSTPSSSNSLWKIILIIVGILFGLVLIGGIWYSYSKIDTKSSQKKSYDPSLGVHSSFNRATGNFSDY